MRHLIVSAVIVDFNCNLMKYQLSVFLLTGDAEKETGDKTVVFNPYSSSRDSKVSTSIIRTRHSVLGLQGAYITL